MTIPDSGCMMENGSIELPCTPEEESRIIRELVRKAESSLQEGNTYYLLSTRWYLSWQKYTGQPVGFLPYDDHPLEEDQSSTSAHRPGPIDNNDLLSSLTDAPQLLRTIEEGRDYVLLPEEAWGRLHEWYKGGPALARKMITAGDRKELQVEIHPLCLNLVDSRNQDQCLIQLSKKASLNDLYAAVCQPKGLELEKVRILDYFNQEKQAILAPSDQTLEDSNLQMDQHILLEVQQDGFWPSGHGMDSTGNNLAVALVPIEPSMSSGYGMDSAGNNLAVSLVPMEPSRSSVSIAGGPSLSNGYSNGFSTNMYNGISLSSSNGDVDGYELVRNVSRQDRGGLAGLQNLGNTCFMNSSLQCLAHTPPIMEYFLQDYTDEINRQNPLGMHGELALAFGDLLRKLWSSGQTSVAPRAFKLKLARFAPQFSGYNQHDSQELLAFLLDGLHEDLNRVKQKPYIETKDCDGRPDEEVADDFWRYHKARNNSIIVDVCQGQYKSTLVCPSCSKVSVTFDPFMYLSLPLPSTATRVMTVTVFHGDGSSLPMPFTVTVLKNGTCHDLVQALATACCLRADEYLLLAEVYDYKIFRYMENPSDLLENIKDNEYMVAYRLPRRGMNFTRLEITHRFLQKSILDNQRAGERKLFLTPLVTLLEDPQSSLDIDEAIGRVLAPLGKGFSQPTPCNADELTSCSSPPEEDVSMEITEAAEEESSSGKELSFHFCLTEHFSCRPIVRDAPLKFDAVVKILLDWTEREYELYDANYLKDIPVVHKAGKKTKQEVISLFSCLDAFLKEEPLGPDDMWYCPECKEHRQATKKLDLWRLPDVLVIHLKRFSYSRWLKNKLDTFVNFPVRQLDLSNYVSSNKAAEGDHMYELYAISNHYGGLGGGHYSAYCKLIDDDNRWYHFDDSHVSQVSEDDIKTSAAYVLFYQRVGSKSKSMAGESSQKCES